MKISVVVPFFNEEKHIGSCIAALTNQSYPSDDYEIILVDNNSTDGSAAIARRDPRVRVVKEEIQGDYAARNRGIAEATGDIIAFTDADTAPVRNWLAMVDAAMQKSGLLVLVGGLRFSSDSSALSVLAAYETAKMTWIYNSSLEEVYVAYTCNMAVRREAFDQLGLFPEIQRNAEIIFMRRIIDTHGVAALQYAASVEVDRLEISSLRQYYSKLHVYGRDYRRYANVASLRALTNAERIHIFRKTVESNGYSRLQASKLLLLLAIGGLCYDAGRLAGPSD
ncbi:MAG: glycosyltransferase family 2 protein [Rhodothermales bacterium]|nr:glycosyltransferase family 2 protein [Rhodothermales bacterium]